MLLSFVLLNVNKCAKHSQKLLFSNSTSVMGDTALFKGTPDRFRGILVDSRKEACNIDYFSFKLDASLSTWQKRKVRGVWFKVSLENADWVPELAKRNFWFHHANREEVMMCRWLPDETVEKCNIPPYCHTMLSVGGLVTDSQGRMLVIKEKFWKMPNWKLPGGYIENREDIADAAIREVFEETGLKVRFNSIVGFLHSHTSQFNCSDIYLIAHLAIDDEAQEIKKCEREIAECCWMKIEEYLNHDEVHKLNKLLVKQFLDNKEKRIAMLGNQIPHPIFSDKQVTVFHLNHEGASSNL